VDKDSYYRGFTDACDVATEWMRGQSLAKWRVREFRDFVDEKIRKQKAQEILSDLGH
jgi:hypothetical protein